MRTYLTIAALVAVLCTAAFAAADRRDRRFGSKGLVLTSFGTREAVADDVLIQPDGKIVAVGGASGSQPTRVALARYTDRGLLDTSFGTGGKVLTQPLAQAAATGVARQADGKIVVAGSGGGFAGEADFFVTRYNPNGTLDTTFGTGGTTVTSFGPLGDTAYDLAVGPDGKIVLAGITVVGSDFDCAVARYDPNGVLDPTFDGDGMAIVDVSGVDDFIYNVAVQPDLKILLSGASNGPAGSGLSAARLNVDGTLDGTFGTGGKVLMNVVMADFGRGMALQPDGKIVLASEGRFLDGTEIKADFIVVRLTDTGTPDPAFGTNGIVRTNVRGNAVNPYGIPYSVAIAPDGKIVVAGYRQTRKDSDFALVRYNTNGTLDTTFGAQGIQITNFGKGTIRGANSLDSIAAVAVEPDGQAVAAGTSDAGLPRNSGGARFALARYAP